MTSKVYYKFKSQKNPSEISFDGTGISVFDLKREILLHSKLAPIAETIDLQVINPDTKEEYQDDTEVIPRSMSVVARRLPATRPGKDSAAKYVSGAVPTGGGKNAQRQEANMFASSRSAPSNVPPSTPAVGTEDDNVSAMFEAQGEKWKQTQEHMATATPIYYTSHSRAGANVQVPDHPPPPGYICYRCGSKGHWIQVCPTNNDPNWEGKRVRRTTGIPKTMLRTVKVPDDNVSGTYMVNEDGEYVEVVADNKSWQNYQERTKAMKNKADVPEDPELVCPLTHKLFEKPVKTPCCGKTYSSEAIQQALLDSDFVCPNCKQEEILLDSLIPDTEMEAKVEAYKNEKNETEKPLEEAETETTSLKRTREDSGSETEDHTDKKGKIEDEKPVEKAGNDGETKNVEGSFENQQMAMPNQPPPLPFPMMPGMPMPMMPPFMMPGMPFMMPPFMMNQNNNQQAPKPTNGDKN